MEMRGEREIAASRETVWAALTSAEMIRQCVPGAREVTGSPEEGFEAVVVQKVGPVKATFRGTVTFSQMQPPERLTLSGEGKGGAAGFARGSADVTLSETDAGTRLVYEVQAQVGGKLAQLGGRIVDGFAKRMADQFFARLEEAIVGPAAAAPDGDSAAGNGPERPAERPAESAAERPAEAGTAAADGPKPPAEKGGKGWFGRLVGRKG